MKKRAGFLSLTFTAFVLAAVSVASAESHVRIVRLSSVEGPVHMDRATGEGLERAIMNTPVTQGMKLATGSDGLAEVEFENQSALRLTQDSEIKFTQLSMDDSGAKVNRIEVVKGLVYLDSISKGDDVYHVTVGGADLLVRRDTVMRLDASADKIQVAVFKGDVQLETKSPPVTIQKNETLTFDSGNAVSATVAKGTEPVRFDSWNKEREAYTKTYADNTGYGGPNRGFGMQDLNYYGDFFYANGYGYVWQPYGFAGAMSSWDPYSNGAWGFAPGLGYTFASGYPWGWLPYHYGSWAFLNGAGWAWVPGGHYGGQWYANNFQTVPKVVKAPAGWTAPAPPVSRAAGTPTVLVGKTASGSPSIPGGRIPPKFGSVIAPHSAGPAAASHGFASPDTRNVAASHSTFASPETGLAAHRNSSAHVFAAPVANTRFVNPITADPYESGKGQGAGRAPTHAGIGIVAGGGTSGSAHATTAGGAHH